MLERKLSSRSIVGYWKQDNWAELALLRNLNVLFCPSHYVMTCAFGFSISNIDVNISGPSISVNVATSDSLVIYANNIGIDNASFGSVIVPTPFENDCSSSYSLTVTDSSTFFAPKPGSIGSISFSIPFSPTTDLVQLKNVHPKNQFFFHFLFYEVKPFTYEAISLV